VPGFGLAIAASWIVTEWLRGWVFTGFAWNPLGIALLGPYETQGLALAAKWIGTYGLSGLLVVIAAALRQTARVAWIATARQRAAMLAGSIAGVALLTALMTSPATYLPRSEGAQPFTLVQPDLRQEVLEDPGLFEANFRKLADLTTPSLPSDRRVVFWPESGLPDYLRDGYPAELYRYGTYGADPEVARQRIGQAIGPYSLLLTGAVDAVVEEEEWVAVRNSVTAIDWRGHILAGYAKAHLVPYGEYLPMRSLLEPIGLSRLVPGTLDFLPGPGPRTYDFGDWGEAGIQICYEIVFSGEVVDPSNRPDYIFNPSNDGWFGSWGPPQHLAQARLRALEEGLPVMRATTTGISAVIDADGIVRQFVLRHQAGRLDGMIPPAAEPTLFARYGNVLPILLAGLLLAVSLVAMRRPKR
jgi:apolipoprotein N-acyltransferase